MTWQFASALDIGDRKEQQDRVAILHSETRDTHLLVVADGMGGHQDGAAAAQTVIDIATKQFNSGIIINPREFLEKICLDAHDAISMLAEDRASAPGSTCVILYLKDTEAYWVHVGDSRIYQYFDNKLIYKTSDHSIAQLMKEQKSNLGDNNKDAAPQNQLYMCLGGNNKITPEFCASNTKAGDLFLLCSDGLWAQLSVGEMFASTELGSLNQEHTEQLVELARKQGQGKSDNISLAWAYHQGDTSRYRSSGLLKRLTGWFS